jgi:hypothetical protein
LLTRHSRLRAGLPRAYWIDAPDAWLRAVGRALAGLYRVIAIASPTALKGNARQRKHQSAEPKGNPDHRTPRIERGVRLRILRRPFRVEE